MDAEALAIKALEAVHTLAERDAEFQGTMAEFVRHQRVLNEQLTTIVANDIPHLRKSLAKLEGKVATLLWLVGAFMPVIGGLATALALR